MFSGSRSTVHCMNNATVAAVAAASNQRRVPSTLSRSWTDANCVGTARPQSLSTPKRCSQSFKTCGRFWRLLGCICQRSVVHRCVVPHDVLTKVPVFLVDFDTLNAQTHSAHSNMPRESKAPAVYGVCLSDVDHFAHRSVQQFFRLEMAPTRRVHGIMVLHGLPFDMTAYILAHEATHAYFKLHDGFPTSLPLKVEEGTCQLVGYLYLQYRKVMAGDDSDRPHAAKLRDWYLESLVNDPSPVYGDGLRDALHAFNSTNSLQVLLDHIRETSAFPSV
ncbi:hypothetical protein, variant 1 [Aphanomyces invadans]|uniref:Protein DA1-like domain-containing protein n=1 Tax=Aphanomyces invadans TaxID=157072 RepID=A0A024URD1_9STRA|nr:hypothetical protein, variant 1 [Aphanomyces invadans]ETW08745.1 hypothetical protein, variant 1 [Aphanomyces invadans]|eukprot:XP_008862550.1 hypothetical protein, variant 1 [Aphanomyces invadans]